jgi:hypothetical protein
VLADKPAEGLVATVVSGRPGHADAALPGHPVSEPEAEWIVDQLMRGFPPDAGLPQPRAELNHAVALASASRIRIQSFWPPPQAPGVPMSSSTPLRLAPPALWA